LWTTSHSSGARGSVEGCRALALVDNTARKIEVKGEIVNRKWAFIIWDRWVEVKIFRVIETSVVVSKANWNDAVRVEKELGGQIGLEKRI
jgi:hypothetical protein